MRVTVGFEVGVVFAVVLNLVALLALLEFALSLLMSSISACIAVNHRSVNSLESTFPIASLASHFVKVLSTLIEVPRIATSTMIVLVGRRVNGITVFCFLNEVNQLLLIRVVYSNRRGALLL